MNYCEEIVCEKNSIENYVEEILTLNICKLFLPTCIIKDLDSEVLKFDCLELNCMRNRENLRTEDAMTLLINLLENIDDGEEHYIFPDEYKICADNIYFNEDFSIIKMRYETEIEELTGPEKIIALIEEVKVKVSAEGANYLDDIINFIANSNFKYSSLIHYIRKLRKEVYLCAVE